MAAFIVLQQDSLEFRSNASISAYPGQKKESVWTQKAVLGRAGKWGKLLTWATAVDSRVSTTFANTNIIFIVYTSFN